MNDLPIVVCIKVGTKYDATYVNRLHYMVERNLKAAHTFVCLTDDGRDLQCPWTLIETDLPGWWAKLVLFKPHPILKGHRVIYLDLDTVIMNSIDFLVNYHGPFAILRDFYNASGWGSAIMSIASGFAPYVWSEFKPVFMDRYHGDQDWIQQQISHATFLQDIFPGEIGSYKADNMQDDPQDFSICCFHGDPKPHEVGGWVRRHWQ